MLERMPTALASAAGLVAFLGSQLARADDAQADVTVQPPVTVAPAAPSAPPPPPPVLSRSQLSEWPEDAPPPPGYHWQKRAHLGPIIGGAALLGSTWGLSSFVGALAYDLSTTHDPNYEWLFLPVFGPFVELKYSSTATGSVVLVIDGLAQAGGLALLIYGIASPVMRLRRDEVSTAVHVMPVPMVLGRDGGGLGVVGTF